MLAQTEKEGEKMYASYCCYPNQVREMISSQDRKIFEEDNCYLGDCWDADLYKI